jgi:FkbM family methyltransferase
MESLLKRIIKYFPRKIKKLLVGDVLKYIDRRFENFNRQLEILEKIAKGTINLVAGIDFQGQVGQDILAYLYFGSKKDGFYIDIGANDGKTFSNTIIFEKLGWEGICVEPLPDVYKILKQNRQCDCFNVAIAEKSGESTEFIKASGVEKISGLNSKMTDIHKKRIISEKGIIEKIYVKTLSFNDLMNNYPDRWNIDFMSIDVEGAEMSILNMIDFNKFNFGLITVENDRKDGDGGKMLIQFMEEHGYKVYLDLEPDIMFIPK